MYRFFGLTATLALGLLPVAAEAQWTVHMRAMQNPLPVGQCTAIEVVALEPNGYAPQRPDGKQASGWDFELDFVASAPDAFAWADERRRLLCARAPTAASAVVVARYPGRHLAAMEIVPGVVAQQSVEVLMQVQQPAGYQSPPPTDPGQTSAQPPAYQQQGYPQQGYPQQQAQYPPQAYPQPAGGQPAYPQPPPAQPPSPDYGYQPTPVVVSAPAPAPAPPPQAAPPAAAPAAAAPAAKPAATEGGQPKVRTGKQFLRRLLGHVKQTADEAATATAGAVADAAGEMVDDKLAPVVGGAQEGQGPPDLTAGLASGRLVLTNLRFVEGTAQVDPSSGPLLAQLAAALGANAGQFLIEAHVDGGDPAAAQSLSDQRAGAVKAALIASGVPAGRLMAAGYGATRPIPGAATSARIEIARAQ